MKPAWAVLCLRRNAVVKSVEDLGAERQLPSDEVGQSESLRVCMANGARYHYLFSPVSLRDPVALVQSIETGAQ